MEVGFNGAQFRLFFSKPPSFNNLLTRIDPFKLNQIKSNDGDDVCPGQSQILFTS